MTRCNTSLQIYVTLLIYKSNQRLRSKENNLYLACISKGKQVVFIKIYRHPYGCCPSTEWDTKNNLCKGR